MSLTGAFAGVNVLLMTNTKTIRISTDEATMTICAASADDAAREFGYASSDALRRAVERSGGYGSLTIDGVVAWRVAR